VKNVVQLFVKPLLFPFLVALPRGILHNSEWIGNDMKTKIHFLWQYAKTMQIHHFSEHSKVILKSRTLTIVDLSTLFNSGSSSQSIIRPSICSRQTITQCHAVSSSNESHIILLLYCKPVYSWPLSSEKDN
jgi:hypothetical protein